MSTARISKSTNNNLFRGNVRFGDLSLLECTRFHNGLGRGRQGRLHFGDNLGLRGDLGRRRRCHGFGDYRRGGRYDGRRYGLHHRFGKRRHHQLGNMGKGRRHNLGMVFG